MAITITNPDHGPMAGAGFFINASSADLSGCEVLKTGVAGKRIVLENILINSAAGLTVTIGQGENASAVVTPLFGPVTMAANSTLTFETGNLSLDAGESLTVDASGAGAVLIFIRGRLV